MIMKIVFYGIPEEEVRRLAGRYGFGLCRSFGEFVAGGGREMLLQPLLRTDGERLDFFGRMARYGASVDAVVVSCADDFSAVHYCSQPGRFFSVSGEAGEEALEYELTRIVEPRLGLVCAHEGVEP